MKRRRQLVIASGLSPLVAPLGGWAQSAQRMRRIGILSVSRPDSEVDQIGRAMSRDSLRRAGWDEGKNLVVERRYAADEAARLDGLARDGHRFDLILNLKTLRAIGVTVPRSVLLRASEVIE